MINVRSKFSTLTAVVLSAAVIVSGAICFKAFAATGDTVSVTITPSIANAVAFVKYNGAITKLPTTLQCPTGTDVTLQAVVPDGNNCAFENWAGPIFSTNDTITDKFSQDTNLTVNVKYNAAVDIAQGAPVTCGVIAVPPSKDMTMTTTDGTWWPQNLTDGDPNTKYTTSDFNQYTTDGDISNTPCYLSLDLGAAKTFDTLKLYPRTDATAAGGLSANFPADFIVQTSQDGTTYTDVQEFKPANPAGQPATFNFASSTAQYVRLKILNLGLTTTDEVCHRVQLNEFQLYNGQDTTNVALGAAVTAKVDATNAVPQWTNMTWDMSPTWCLANLTDGDITTKYTTLDFSQYTLDANGNDNGGDISATPCVMDIDLGDTMTFDKIMLAPRTDAVTKTGTTPAFPTDLVVQASQDGKTYTDVQELKFSNPMGVTQSATFAPTTAQYVRLKVLHLGEIASDEQGDRRYRIQINEIALFNTSDTGDTVEPAFNLDKNGNGSGTVKINGKTVTLPYSQSYPVGTNLAIEEVPDANSAGTGFTGDYTTPSRVTYVQVNKDTNLTAGFKTTSGSTGSIKLSAGATSTTVGNSVQLTANVTNSSALDNSLAWSVEDANGNVSDCAELLNTDTNQPTLVAEKAGTFNVVARFNSNGLATAGTLAFTVTDGTVSSTPASSTPASSTPASSTPASSTPASSTPASSTPVSSTPVSSTPVSSTPASSTPVSSTPASSTPVSSTPASSTPASSTPASSTPASSTPDSVAPVSSTPDSVVSSSEDTTSDSTASITAPTESASGTSTGPEQGASKNSGNPYTGDNGIAIPFALLGLCSISLLLIRHK